MICVVLKIFKTRYKIDFREVYYSSRCAQTMSAQLTLSIAVNKGSLAKNYFWLVATQKKKACVLNLLMGKKLKENFFPTGSRRTALRESSI